MIVNIRNTEKQIEGLEFLFVELPKFKPQNRAEKKLHELWMRFLTEINENTKEVPKELLDNEFTHEAVKHVEKAAYTKEQLQTYDKWKIAAMTERSALKDAKKEGRAEEKIEIAKKMLKMGMSIEIISNATGLIPKQIIEI